MDHLEKPQNFDWTLEDLAKEIWDLKYDSMAKFFALLWEKIASDWEKDLWRWRNQLWLALWSVAEELKKTSEKIENIWKICEKYM